MIIFIKCEDGKTYEINTEEYNSISSIKKYILIESDNIGCIIKLFNQDKEIDNNDLSKLENDSTLISN